MSLLDRLAYVAKTILGVMRDPTSNLTVAFLTMATIALGLILLLLLLYGLVNLRDWEEVAEAERSGLSEPSEEERAAARKRRRLRLAAAGCLLALVLVVTASASTSDPACRRCHYTAAAFASRAKGVHADIACSRCHVSPGASGRILAAARGVRNAAATFGGADTPTGGAMVPDRGCISCHRDVSRGIIVAQGIRVRHSDIIASGRACTDCHNTVAHGDKLTRPRYPTMESCLPCHDGVKVSASCETCHVGDPGVAVRRLPRGFKKAALKHEDCEGCHSVESCTECHGLELPHSRKFVEGYHAKQAFAEKELCLKCHDLYGFCSKGCHHFRAGLAEGTNVIAEQHGPTFRSYHRSQPARECAGCHQNPDMCRYCHER